MKKVIVLMFLVLLPFSVLAERQLTREEVIQTYSGKTVYGKHASKEGVNGFGWYAPDGTLRTKRKGESIVKGKWWVNKKNGSLCLKRKGKKRCRYVVENEGVYDKYKVKKGGGRGDYKWTDYKFAEGNVEGM